MVKKIIVNADDFGLTEGVTLGIIKGHVDGVLTSTTTMVNMKYAKQALLMAKDHPKLGVGIHLVLTAGKPVLGKANTLTDENGFFKKQEQHLSKDNVLNQEELYNEWKAQIELFKEYAGCLPDHIDSHHHMHGYFPEIALKLSQEYNLPVRTHKRIPYRFGFANVVPDFYDKKVNFDYFKTLVTSSKDDIIEIPCHPALVDQDLIDLTSYSIQRANDLAVICDERLKELIKTLNIELINFQQL